MSFHRYGVFGYNIRGLSYNRFYKQDDICIVDLSGDTQPGDTTAKH
jgi:hypothetical protein